MPHQSALSAGNEPLWKRVPSIAPATAMMAAAYALVVGVVTLLGWTFKLPRLTDWNNDGISMFANAAACAIMPARRFSYLAAIMPGHAAFLRELWPV